MSMSHLGDTFDIHCGGRDLIFPHHENEIAQSEGASGCEYVRYWMHNGFINIDEEKMSKSLGNVFNIRDITERYEPLVLRFFLMTGTHYRNPINFSDSMLEEASARVAYFYETLRKVEDFLSDEHGEHDGALSCEALIGSFKEQFNECMNDDFNVVRMMDPIAEIFKTLNELVTTRKQKKKASAAASARALLVELRDVDTVLNLFSAPVDEYLVRHRLKAAGRRGLASAWIETRISERIAARVARDWSLADEIRDDLLANGIVLMDHPGGTEWMIQEGRDTEAADP